MSDIIARFKPIGSSTPKVVWEISCDEIDVRMFVEGISHHQMVEELLKRGFLRLIKSELPYQDEPLAFTDAHNRVWDAMPEYFKFVGNLPNVKEMADKNEFRGAPR